MNGTSSISDSKSLGAAGLTMLGLAGIAGAVYAFSGNTRAVLVLIVGMVVVGLLLLLYRALLGWARSRKAAPMTRGILNNTAAAPNAVSDPAKRAKLDELRKSFESGISKFRAAGKDLYSLPWYVLVGEPGGGKTEAIRHSQVGFPPGLQAYTQGAGGTVNMNWWFTNHAIILDTAGRLMFEEVPTGATSEWHEFLELLTKVRPNCPINGMILVIPADTLIKDTADKIERKAGKIAQQLDQIQRDLGVRFPVFVLVTKCDLINGFREFFDGLDDPQLQHQMLGWSNPAPLDTPFNAEQVDQHMETVRQRLAARRYALLMDPVHTEDPNERRIDQVDALYTFPESFTKIVPRLRRYLEMIFVAGEWSPKPLFLRGIYFTSSMREGSALDQELADVLRIPVDSDTLQEHKVWERDRAFFLRDVFLKKVFPEKGLVTRAVSPRRLQRRRKLAVMTAGFAAVIILMALTWFGQDQFKKSLGDQSAFWRTAAEQAQLKSWAIVGNKDQSGAFAYRGQEAVPVPDAKTMAEFFAAGQSKAEHAIDIPAVFRLVNLVASDFSTAKRAEAYRLTFESRVLGPLTAAARARMASDTTWTPQSTRALVEMIRLARSADAAGVRNEPRLNLDALFAFVLPPDAHDRYQSQQRELKVRHGKTLQDVMTSVYRAGSSPGVWPPPNLAANSEGARAEINNAVARFDKYWNDRLQNPTSASLSGVEQLHKAQQDFDAARDRLRQLLASLPATKEEYIALRSRWDADVEKLAASRAAVDKAIDQIEHSQRGWPEGDSLAGYYQSEINALNAEARKAYATVRDEGQGLTWLQVPELPPEKTLSRDDRQQLDALDSFVAKVKYNDQLQRRYAVCFQVYQLAAKQLAEAELQEGAADVSRIVPLLDTVGADAAAGAPAALASQAGIADDRLRDTVETWRLAAEAAARCRRYRLIDSVLPTDKVPPERWAVDVARAAESLSASVPHPGTIPLTGIDRTKSFAQEYNPTGAFAVLSQWAAVGTFLESPKPAPPAAAAPRSPQSGPRVLDRDQLARRYADAREGLSEYARRYARYWSDEVPNTLAQPQLAGWDDFVKSVEANGQAWGGSAINVNLGLLCDRIREALLKLEPVRPAYFGDDQSLKTTADRIDLARRPTGDVNFGRACQAVVASWRETLDPLQARANILDKKPAEFMEAYVPPAPDDGFVTRYWTGLSERLIKQLAARCDQVAVKRFDERIKKFARFPLAPHHFNDPADRPLTQQELDDVRTAVLEFLPGGGAAPGSKRIADGALPLGYSQNDSLEKLRKLNVPPGDPTWFARVSLILDALSNTAPSKVTVSVLNGRDRRAYLQNRNGAEFVFAFASMEQGPNRPGQQRVDPDDDVPLGTFTCRGEPILLKLSSNVAGNAPPVTAADFKAPWSGIELLWSPQVTARKLRSTQAGAQTWDVEVSVSDGKNKWPLWLRLAFEKELPSQWPDLRK